MIEASRSGILAAQWLVDVLLWSRSTAAAMHWSIRSMPAETSSSHTMIRRMWAALGLQPHRTQTFTLSSDTLFVDKVRDIDGRH